MRALVSSNQPRPYWKLNDATVRIILHFTCQSTIGFFYENSLTLQEYTKSLMKKSSLIVVTGLILRRDAHSLKVHFAVLTNCFYCQGGGVIRHLKNYGEQELAYKMRRNHAWFDHGR